MESSFEPRERARRAARAWRDLTAEYLAAMEASEATAAGQEVGVHFAEVVELSENRYLAVAEALDREGFAAEATRVRDLAERLVGALTDAGEPDAAAVELLFDRELDRLEAAKGPAPSPGGGPQA